MEPATSFPIAQEPPSRRPPQTAQLGQAQRRWDGWARCAFPVIVLLAVTGGFAWAVYRASRSRRDLAFLITTYYLIAALYCCLRKLELLRLDDPAAAAPMRRRVRFAVWAVSVALGNTLALRIADAMPYLALKLAVWGLTVVTMGLAFYFFFCRKDGESCDAEHGHAQADAGRRPEKALHKLTPEERV